VTKPRDIVRRISKEAKRRNLGFGLLREGANHTIYSLDGLMVVVPRHREVSELTTQGIYRECEQKLGKGWWRR